MENNNTDNRTPNILIIDDDPIFRANISKVGKKMKLPLTVCASMRELNSLALPKLFDVAIVDYYLDGLKEYMRGTDIAAVLDETPVILVSSNNHCLSDAQSWPQSVRKFMNKQLGVQAILKSALQIRHALEVN